MTVYFFILIATFCSYPIFGSNSLMLATDTFRIYEAGNNPSTTNGKVSMFGISGNGWNVSGWGVDTNRCVVTNSQGGTSGASLTSDYLYLVFKNIKINKTPHTISCWANKLLHAPFTASHTINGFTLEMPTPIFESGSSLNIPCYFNTAQISLNDYINADGLDNGLEITDEFEWTLPSGWRTSDSKTGTFVDGPTINIVAPLSSTTENIIVRAKAYDQYSNSASLQITRHIGEFSITGHSVVDCKRAYTFSTQYGYGVSYNWSLPSGWEGTTTSSSIHPSAGKAGTIRMIATACGESDTAYFEVTRSKIISDASYITGSDLLCSIGSEYGLSNVYNNNPTITWTVSDNIETPSSSGRYVTLHATSNGPGSITATISNPSCDTDERVKENIWVGGPDLENITVYYSEDITGTYPDEFCPGYANELLAIANPLIDMHLNSIYWDMGSWDVYYYDDEGYVLFGIPLNFNEYQDVYYEVANACDVVITSETLYEGSCGGYFMIISPNPSSGETTLTIEAANKEEPIDLNEEWDLEIYDQQQNLKEKFQKNKGNKKVINVSNWKEGHYFLRAKYKDKYILGRLIVSKNN